MTRFVARLVLVLVAMGIVPSPLRAVAAPFPMLFAYDVAVRPTTTTVLGAHEAVRSEAERPRFNDYECMRGGYDDPSNAPVMAGAGGVHAYDDALALLERRELAEAAIYGAVEPTAAAEGSTALVEGGEVWNVRGGIDFSKSTADEGQVQIQYTGSRTLDYQAANQAAGLGDSMRAPSGFVWHHLDDYNPLTNTGTMQLVDQAAHMANAPHVGGVAQWVEWMGFPYAP